MSNHLFQMGFFLCACLCALACAMLPSQARAGERDVFDFDPHGLYVTFSTGVAAPRDGDTSLPLVPSTGELEFDGDVSFAGGLGFTLNRHVRLEGELSYRSPDADSATLGGVPAPASGDLSTYNLMLNTYYDFRPTKRFNPYVTAGIGGAWHNADLSIAGTRADDSDLTLAWQAGAGVSYAVNDRFSLTGGYRYIDSGNPDFGAIRTETRAHEFRIGITIKLTPAALDR